MLKLIDRYAETIPSSQARIALEILRRDREDGRIHSKDEYTESLKNFLSTSSSRNPIPLLSLVKIRNFSSIDLSDFNYMLHTIEGDLKTLFTEINNMMEMIEGHHEIYQNTVLHDLMSSLDTLEQELNKLRITRRHGFQVGTATEFSQRVDQKKFPPEDYKTTFRSSLILDLSDPKQ